MEERVSEGFLQKHRLTWLLLGSLLLVRLIFMAMTPYLDTTEARYGEIARKMLDMNDWITPWFDHGEPYWGKPPFAFWLTALGFKTFGINEFAGRLPHLLTALAVVGLVGWLAARRDSDAFVAAVALLFGAFLYFVLAGAVVVDVEYTLAFTMTMTGFWLAMEDRERKPHAVDWLAAVFFFGGLALGLLTRGPIAVVLPGITLTLWTAWHRRGLDAWQRLPWLSGSLATLVLVLPWYILAERLTPGFLRYFIVGEHIGRYLEPGWSGDRYGFAHHEPFGTIWIYAILGTLPWSIIVPAGCWRWSAAKSSGTNDIVNDGNPNVAVAERAWRDYLLLWALVPLLFFTPARNVTMPYVMPALPAFALLTARRMMQSEYRQTAMRVLNIGLVVDLLLLIALLRLTMFPETLTYRTEKYLVQSYQNATANAAGSSAQPLIYIGGRPFSAGFYTGARALRVDGPDQILPLVGKEAAYLATTNPQALITWFDHYNKTDGTTVDSNNARRSLMLIGRYGNRSLFFLEKNKS